MYVMKFHSKRTFRTQALFFAAFIAVAALLTSCASTGLVGVNIDFPAKKHKKAEPKIKVKNKKHGPPPHAPAHGYRHKHQDGTELVFDDKLSVYVVVDLSDTYFKNDLYIRTNKGRWEVSATVSGPWRKAATKEVPPKLKAKYGKKHAKGRKNKKK